MYDQIDNHSIMLLTNSWVERIGVGFGQGTSIWLFLLEQAPMQVQYAWHDCNLLLSKLISPNNPLAPRMCHVHMFRAQPVCC